MRSALYAWGGPGTVRLLKTKYFSPKVHQQSFCDIYQPDFLKKARQIFGTTDMFVTYSWGFSDKTEREDRAFILSRLKNFAAEDIKTYAYIQGFNLVYNEFPEQDLWCRNSYGDVLMYSKDRAFTCPNNPQAIKIIKDRIRQASAEKFEGIFVDNLLFGLPPLYIYTNETSFFGCSCLYCQKAFKKFSGYPLTLGRKKSEQVIADYLMFRRKTVEEVIASFAEIAHSYGKVFGINLYDPFRHSAPYYFGYDLYDIRKFLDYFLIENHALGDPTINNLHLQKFLKNEKKSVFVVSYRQGIGREPAYSQNDLNLIYSESRSLGYIPCYKATEYTTEGLWHALRINTYTKVQKISTPSSKVDSTIPLQPISEFASIMLSYLNIIYEQLAPRLPQYMLLSSLFLESSFFSQTLRKRRIYTNS